MTSLLIMNAESESKTKRDRQDATGNFLLPRRMSVDDLFQPNPIRSGVRNCLLASLLLISFIAQAEVRFRLPLSSNTTTHYYVDHDTTSGVKDWKCAGETYNGHHGTDFSGGPRGRE